MKRSFLSLVCSAGILLGGWEAGSAQTAGSPPLEALAAKVRPSVVEITGSIEGSDDTSYGTGFVVKEPGLVVTNAHVLRGVRLPMVRTFEGAVLASTELILVDERVDLALLRVRGLTAPPLPLAEGTPPAVGARVVAVGHPRGYDFTVSEGIVSAWRRLKESGPEMIQTTTPISPGSSGGPLLDLEGKVVGVASLTLTEGQNINFAVPVQEIGPVLAKGREVELALSKNSPERMPPEGLALLLKKERENGDLVHAADLANRAVSAHPRSLPVLLEAAEVAWSRGNYQQVEKLLSQIDQVQPGFGPARQVRAALLAQRGRCAEAVPEAEAALRANLDFEQAAEAHAVLGECLGRLSKPEEALEHLDLALTNSKIADVADYHVLRAFLLKAKGLDEEADGEAVIALEKADWDPLVLGALRERGLPRLVVVESQRLAKETGVFVMRGVVRNRGPIALGEVTITAEAKDAQGVVIVTGTAKVTPAKLVPGQTGSFKIVLDGMPAEPLPVQVRIVDFKESR